MASQTQQEHEMNQAVKAHRHIDSRAEIRKFGPLITRTRQPTTNLPTYLLTYKRLKKKAIHSFDVMWKLWNVECVLGILI